MFEASDWLFWKDVSTNYMCPTCPLESGVDNGRQPIYLCYIFILSQQEKKNAMMKLLHVIVLKGSGSLFVLFFYYYFLKKHLQAD